ncbi:MAG: hypothetical protein ACE5IR_05480 [bacterium]
MKKGRITYLCLGFILIAFSQPTSAQFFNPTDAAIIAKLGDILRTHRQNLVETIRAARGIERTFTTLNNLNEYEKSLRRDINFISSMDLTRLDDLERLILFGDQTDFYFRSLTGKLNADMYNASQMTRYGDGFLGAVDGLGLVDANLIRALFNDDKTLAELGIPPEQVAAVVKELSIESNLLELYQVKGTENLVKALTEQAEQLKKVAKDSALKLDPGQRLMLLTKSEESYIEAMKYQQELASKLQNRNQKMTRKLLLKGEIEAEIAELEKFYKWHSSLEHNLGFFDTEFVKRENFK